MPVPEISVEELADLLGQAPVLLDVRTSGEFVEGHIPGSQLVPLAVLVAQDTTLSVSGPVYLICGSGVRSTRAAETLRAHGIEAVVITGGVQAWTASARPLARGL